MRRGALLLAPALMAAAGAARAAPPSAHPTQVAALSVGMPSEFLSLAAEHQLVADVFFGGRRIGQFGIVATPGTIHILHPEAIVAAMAGLSDPRAVRDALGGTLDNNARYICTESQDVCGRPSPDVAAVVFDERRFRLDLYLNPRLLAVQPVTNDRYLKPTQTGLAMVDTIGGAIAGGDGERTDYDIRNRAVVADGDARIVADTSYATGQGIDIDTLAAELDRPDIRYTAGLFYAPGADLVGRRRIVGAGIASQFDTRTDREQLTGTPLIVSLGQRSRVDLYSEGRLINSHVYEAGNQTVDTSSLPDGSYPVELRIQAFGGPSRTEQRFFTKSTAIPPVGHTVFFADAGLLAADRAHQLLGVSHMPIASAGAARRVGSHFAWDATVMATAHKQLAEIGVSLLTAPFQARAAALGSVQSDYAVLLQATSTAFGRLNYTLDLRHVQSRDGRPLIPLDQDSLEALAQTQTPGQGTSIAGTTFTQMIGNLSYRIGHAQIGLTGSLRHDVGQRSSYAIGPTLHWPILQRGRLQLTADGSYAETDRGRSMAVGLRMQLFGARSSLNASVGAQGDAGRGTAAIADVGGSIQRDLLGGQASASGNLQRSEYGTELQATADERGPMGYASGTLVHRVDGAQSSTQYGLTMQTVVAATHGALRVGAHDQDDSIVAVRIDGTARGTTFEVLVNDASEGVLRAGERLTVAVPSYHRYTVRIRPVGGQLVAFDTRARTIDVYPGSVAVQLWKVDAVLAMFGRMIRPDGSVVANADIDAGGAISATDERGYFQIQAARDAVLTVRSGDGTICHATLAATGSDKPYTALGNLTCRP